MKHQIWNLLEILNAIFLSKTYRQHDLLAIGSDVAEICTSIAESSFPHYFYRMNKDRGSCVLFFPNFC